MESQEQNCRICSQVFDCDSATLEDVLDLFKFLVATIDTSALKNALICGACLGKIHEAVNFKISLLVKQETINIETRQEINCDEKCAICYICKNTTKLNSSMPLFNSSYENVVKYIIPKQDLGSLVDPQICVSCHTSALNFQSITLFLSVYDLNKTNMNQLNTETVTDEKEFKIDIVEKCLSEDNKLNVGMPEEVKQEIKEEIGKSEDFHNEDELDLKIDCEAGPSSAGFWNLNRDQKRSSILPCPENLRTDADDSNLICETDMDYKQSSKLNKLKSEKNKVKIFRCENCDYQTKWKRDLKRHMLSHKNIDEVKLFKCQNCKFRTKYKNYIKIHELTHKDINEVQMFKCLNCDYYAKQKRLLKQHMFIHEDINKIKMYKCQKCQYQTRRKGQLKAHALIHAKTES